MVWYKSKITEWTLRASDRQRQRKNGNKTAKLIIIFNELFTLMLFIQNVERQTIIDKWTKCHFYWAPCHRICCRIHFAFRNLSIYISIIWILACCRNDKIKFVYSRVLTMTIIYFILFHIISLSVGYFPFGYRRERLESV